MSVLLDVLLTEQLVAAFRSASRESPDLNVESIPHPGDEAAPVAGGGAAVRITTRAGESLVVTPRRIAREVGDTLTDLVVFSDLVGYDWISTDLSEKVRLKDAHYDRLYLHVRGARDVVLDNLGPAVYPLMAYLAKVLQLRSQKLLLRQMDRDVLDLITRCLRAAVLGPFFSDEDLVELLEQDRPSLQVVAAMWQRMNLAAPELRRTVEGVMEMLLRRREAHPEAWDRLVGAPPERVHGALEVFRNAVGRSGPAPEAPDS